MAANKFATMLHRNTNNLTLILIYAILEWVLIFLLLLNSLFSYLILNFALFFGLKPPCILCSCLIHIFQSKISNTFKSYRDLVCDDHAVEISQLGFCSTHHKLAESEDMCEGCSSRKDRQEWSKEVGFFPWMKKNDDDFDAIVVNKCSCCGVSLKSDSCVLVKPCWGGFDWSEEPKVKVDGWIDKDDQLDQGVVDKGENSACCSVCDYVCKETEALEDRNEEKVDVNVGSCDENKSCGSQHHQHLEFYIDQEDCRLVPIEVVDSADNIDRNGYHEYKVEEDQGNGDDAQDVILDFNMHFETQASPVMECWHGSEKTVELLSSHEGKETSEVFVLDSKDLGENGEEVKEIEQNEEATSTVRNADATSNEETRASCNEDDNQSNADVVQREIDADVREAATEDDDDSDMLNNENDGEVSIGTDIPDHDIFNEDIQSANELLDSYPNNAPEDPSTSSPDANNDDDHGSKKEDEEFLEFKTLSIETTERAPNGYLSQHHEFEEEKVLPDTPTSIENFHQLYNRMLHIERRESGTEASMDGSAVSDIDCGDGVLTMEKLKSVLRVEREALNRVYAELEEERSASAIAASQTMAMINRLQEEKAAMQMEALQYQRMMDEQSEYDQEAMQLLNELMVKREKEKQELEKELEISRKKVQDYEAKEKMMILRRMREGCARSRTSSGVCSNAEDSDGLSIDLNHEAVKEEDNLSVHEESSNQNTPRNAVLYLEESLASFEEEKLSILDQLKELEEKLLTLNDEEDEEQYEDIKPTDHFFSENGNGYHENGDVSCEENCMANGHSKEMNGTHDPDRKIMGSLKAKRLLPLFNEAEDEDAELNGHSEGYDSVASQEKKKLAIEEEVDHVYERLQSLEADREFLKHCISSLRKGDKGLVLLQEILQHLRDLRSVETRLRNSEEGIL